MASASQTAVSGHAPIIRPAGRDALPAITSVRFFAAFYVVVGHALPWLEHQLALPRPIRIFLGNEYLAVCFFFLLSGFILSYTYAEISPGLPSSVKFWQARFARIYPVYFLSLLLALPFQFHQLTAKSFLAVLSMTQAWNPLSPEMTGAWNYPAWSLSVEAFFYLSFPFIQPRFAAMSRRRLLLVGGLVLLVCILGHTPSRGLGNWNTGSFPVFPIPLPIVRLPEFLLGMAIGNYFVRFGSNTRTPMLTLLAIVVSILALSLTAGPWVSVVVFPFAVLLYSLANSRDFIAAGLSHPILLLLGSASYAIYLLQLPVRDWVRFILSHAMPFLYAINVPLTPLILVLFSIFVFRFWEEPLRRLIRGRFRAGL